jgi:hypothetical protein
VAAAAEQLAAAGAASGALDGAAHPGLCAAGAAQLLLELDFLDSALGSLTSVNVARTT